MSDNEKLVQIGRAAEEYGNFKGQLNQVREKIGHALQDYQLAAQVFPNLRAENGKLVFPHAAHMGNQPRSLDGLLNASQLTELLAEEERLSIELNAAATRLKGLAPNLL
jgi:hypothetical protein